MRIKELFTVPDRKKVTEKVFSRVLISSICSILLCMTCLAGTTWAWFAVSIENTENVIQMADAPNYILQVDGQDFASGEELLVGEHIVSIAHTSLADDLQKKSTLYVTFIVDEVTYGYIILGGEYPYSTNVTISNEESCVLSWTVSWFKPGNPDVKPLIDNTIHITAEDPTDESTDATDPTNESTESTDATDPTNESTESTDPTDEPTAATDPTDESTAATDPTVDSLESETQPTDGTTPPAEQESSPMENES